MENKNPPDVKSSGFNHKPILMHCEELVLLIYRIGN